MFCVHCGKEIKDEAIFCPHCGVATHNYKAVAESQPKALPVRKEFNVIALIGFVMSIVAVVLIFIEMSVFLLAVITALVLSIVGAVNSKSCNSGIGFAAAGIAISLVFILFFIAMLLLVLVFALTFLPIFAVSFI